MQKGGRIPIPMTDSTTGERVFWTVKREPKCWFVGVPGRKNRAGQGWSFTDHEGYERFGGETWRELVDRFCVTAENYNFNHRLS